MQILEIISLTVILPQHNEISLHLIKVIKEDQTCRRQGWRISCPGQFDIPAEKRVMVHFTFSLGSCALLNIRPGAFFTPYI